MRKTGEMAEANKTNKKTSTGKNRTHQNGTVK